VEAVERKRGKRESLARRSFAVIAAAAASLATSTLPAAVLTEPAPSSPSIAIIYSETDRAAIREFDAIVAGIESNPGISVYRIPVSAPQLAVGPSPAQGVKVAFNTARPGSIAVIYPDIGEPYRSVFAKIIEGIEDKTRTRVASFPVGADVDNERVAGELRRQNIKVVIALGRHGIKVASGLNRDIGVVAGGVIWAPEAATRAVSVISLAPDPALMFARLKELVPTIRRVFMVYDPKHNAWLARLAKEAAQTLDLELIAHQAGDLRSAVRRYQEILATANPKQDSLWLPQDSTTVEESSVLPLALEKSWDRSLVVFSSNVTHVSRGVLFALYPDNLALGRNLADSALDFLGTGTQDSNTVMPLRTVLLAVNLRTAAHLGLKLSNEQQRQVDLAFPQR
jgi:putative ABC transport system substrate-binding protein